MTRVEERLSELLDTAAPPSPGVPFDAVVRRVRRRRVARWSLLGSVVATAGVVAAMAAVVSAGGRDGSRLATRPTPTARPSTDLVALTRQVKCPPPRAVVSADQLSAFHAVTVVTCGQETRDIPGEGQWTVDVRRVGVGGVAALQAAFARPNEPQTIGGCTLDLVWVPTLVLVDDAGRTLAPAAPVDGCHKPQSQFSAALRAVTWQEVSVRKVRQLVTPQAQAAGCPQQYKNMTFDAAQLGARLSSGGPLFLRIPMTVHVCEYQVTAGDLEVGTFQRGFVPSAADTSRLLSAISRPGAGGSCPTQRKFAAVLTNGGEWATVELGGCWRVARSYPNGDIGSADSTVVRAILSGH